MYFTLWKDREIPAWLPSGVIHNKIDSLPFSHTGKWICFNECTGWEEDKLKAILRESEIDFSSSKTNGLACPQYVFKVTGTAPQQVMIELCKDSVRLLGADNPNGKPRCDCP